MTDHPTLRRQEGQGAPGAADAGLLDGWFARTFPADCRAVIHSVMLNPSSRARSRRLHGNRGVGAQHPGSSSGRVV